MSLSTQIADGPTPSEQISPKELDRSVEPSLEFSYTLGFHLPYLSYLDKEWVYLNIKSYLPTA